MAVSGRGRGRVEARARATHLGVRSGEELVRRAAGGGALAARLLAQSGVVVDLAVVDDGGARLARDERLLAARRVHDREARVAEAEAGSAKEAHLVRPAVAQAERELARERLDLRGAEAVVEHGHQTTHRRVGRPLCGPCGGEGGRPERGAAAWRESPCKRVPRQQQRVRGGDESEQRVGGQHG